MCSSPEDAHIAHHKHVQALYEELLAGVPGIKVHSQPSDARFDSNYWLCTIELDPSLKIKGQENAYKEVIKTAVGGAAGVIHMVDSPVTDCQPNDTVEALRVFMLGRKVEARPVWNRRSERRGQTCLDYPESRQRKSRRLKSPKGLTRCTNNPSMPVARRI